MDITINFINKINIKINDVQYYMEYTTKSSNIPRYDRLILHDIILNM